MPDPNKIKDFLSRTAASLQKAMDSGDAEGVNRFERMLDRAMPMAEKLASQPPPAPMPGATGPAGPQGAPPEAQEPVIPWGSQGAKPQAAAPVMPPTQEGPQVANPFKPTAPQNPMLTMPGGQATPLGAKGVAPKSGTGVIDSLLNLPSLPDLAVTGGKKLYDVATSGPGQELARRGFLGMPGMVATGFGDALGGGAKKPSGPVAVPEMPGAEPSSLEGPETPGLPTDNKMQPGEPELAEMMDNPADDVEAEALRRIKNELAERPSMWKYLMMFLMVGAPRTVATMMQDEDRYAAGKSNVYSQIRAENERRKNRDQSNSFREREVASGEKRAKAYSEGSAARAEAAEGGDISKTARAILSNSMSSDEDKAWARRMSGISLPK